ncbi:high mobility group protein 20A-like [Dysidea avara]|uniref:high mobility group protein 20A-like n=1 Tax=Dysidea avara TaxID=196820 RepID=UPI00332EB4CB
MSAPHEHAKFVTLVNEEVPEDGEEGYSEEDTEPSSINVPVIQVGVKRGRGRPRGSTKKVKRTAMKDPNAPRHPTSAYLLFCQQKRDKLRLDHPTMTFLDITKELGQQWTQLEEEERRHFYAEAEKDRERYIKEFQEYQRSEAYREFMKSKYPSINKAQSYRAAAMNADVQVSCTQCGKNFTSEEEKNGHTCSRKVQVIASYNEKDNRVLGTEIPIFTPEFLAHTKELEVELRQLRRSNNDLEEENALLSKHNENLKGMLDRLDQETKEQSSRNEQLRTHLTSLRQILASAFQDISLPGFQAPTLSTIDSYMTQLQSLIMNGSQEHQQLINEVKKIMKQLQDKVPSSSTSTDLGAKDQPSLPPTNT